MTLFSWCLHTSSSVLSSLWNTVSLNLRKPLLWVWSPHKIYQTQIEKMVSIYNTCNNNLQERKSQLLRSGELTSGKQRQNEEVISNIQTGMFWQICHSIAQFYWKTSLKHVIPAFIFSLTDIHSAKSHTVKTKTQALSQRHLSVAKPRVPLKTKTKTTKIGLLFCAGVCLAVEPPCQWFEAAKLTGGQMCSLTDNRPEIHKPAP